MMEILEEVFFCASLNFIFPVNAKAATLKFLGTGDQTDFSFLFRSFLEKLILQVSTPLLNRRLLKGIAISTIQRSSSVFTSEVHLLSQMVVTPCPPPFDNKPSR